MQANVAGFPWEWKQMRREVKLNGDAVAGGTGISVISVAVQVSTR